MDIYLNTRSDGGIDYSVTVNHRGRREEHQGMIESNKTLDLSRTYINPQIRLGHLLNDIHTQVHARYSAPGKYA